MSETLDKELDNMEQVDEGSNPVTKNAKPGDPIDTSKLTLSLLGEVKGVCIVSFITGEGRFTASSKISFNSSLITSLVDSLIIDFNFSIFISSIYYKY